MRDMQRAMIATAMVLAASALIVAILALRQAHNESATYADVGAASVAKLRGLMTEDEVRGILGTPAVVFRDNPRAQCWAYHSPYEVRMCFGPKRRLAWWASNVPPKSSTAS